MDPLASPRARSVRDAEPAKLIGWALLLAVGLWSLSLAVGAEHPGFNLVLGLILLTLLAGFVQSHRYPESVFARVWVGAFTALMVAGAVVAKLAGLVTS